MSNNNNSTSLETEHNKSISSSGRKIVLKDFDKVYKMRGVIKSSLGSFQIVNSISLLPQGYLLSRYKSSGTVIVTRVGRDFPSIYPNDFLIKCTAVVFPYVISQHTGTCLQIVDVRLQKAVQLDLQKALEMIPLAVIADPKSKNVFFVSESQVAVAEERWCQALVADPKQESELKTQRAPLKGGPNLSELNINPEMSLVRGNFLVLADSWDSLLVYFFENEVWTFISSWSLSDQSDVFAKLEIGESSVVILTEKGVIFTWPFATNSQHATQPTMLKPPTNAKPTSWFLAPGILSVGFEDGQIARFHAGHGSSLGEIEAPSSLTKKARVTALYQYNSLFLACFQDGVVVQWDLKEQNGTGTVVFAPIHVGKTADRVYHVMNLNHWVSAFDGTHRVVFQILKQSNLTNNQVTLDELMRDQIIINFNFFTLNCKVGIPACYYWKPKWPDSVEMPVKPKYEPVLQAQIALRYPASLFFLSENLCAYHPDQKALVVYDYFQGENMGLVKLDMIPSYHSIFVPKSGILGNLVFSSPSITAADALMRVWNPETREFKDLFFPNQNALLEEEKVAVFLFTQNLSAIFTGHSTGVIKMWTVQSDKWKFTTQFVGSSFESAHQSQISRMEIDSAEQYLASGAKDGSVSLWSLQQGQIGDMVGFFKSSTTPVLDLRINIDNGFLIALMDDGLVSVFDILTSKLKKAFKLESSHFQKFLLQGLADMPAILMLPQQNSTHMQCCDLKVGKVSKVSQGHKSEILCVTSDRAELVFSLARDGQFRTWHAATGDSLREVSISGHGVPLSILFSKSSVMCYFEDYTVCEFTARPQNFVPSGPQRRESFDLVRSLQENMRGIFTKSMRKSTSEESTPNPSPTKSSRESLSRRSLSNLFKKSKSSFISPEKQ